MKPERIDELANECVAKIREVTDSEFDDRGPETATADAIRTAVREALTEVDGVARVWLAQEDGRQRAVSWHEVADFREQIYKMRVALTGK